MTTRAPACVVCGSRDAETRIVAVDNATAERFVMCEDAGLCQATTAGAWLMTHTEPITTHHAAEAMGPDHPLLVTRCRPDRRRDLDVVREAEAALAAEANPPT